MPSSSPWTRSPSPRSVSAATSSTAFAYRDRGGASRRRRRPKTSPSSPDRCSTLFLAERVLVGVGVAVVGITRRSDGFVHLAPNLGWHEVPLADLLAGQLPLGAPVLAANEADLGALAEHRRGPHAGVANLIYVSGEVGIGAGVIVDGKPLLGSAGYAGEAGHAMINPDGPLCGCGAVGCWEAEAGEAALLRRAGVADGTGHLDEVAERAAAGDDVTLRAIAETGRWVGLGIGNLINLFNPELVVLGGLYQRLFGFLESSVVEGARTRTLDAPGAMATIACSGLGSDAPLIGAAELILSNVIADPAKLEGLTVGGRARRCPPMTPEGPNGPGSSDGNAARYRRGLRSGGRTCHRAGRHPLHDPGGYVGRRRRASSRRRGAAGIHHAYDGDFEFFVGGGVAAFDCDDDRRSGPVSRRRRQPSRAVSQLRAGSGERCASRKSPIRSPDLTRVVGAYPGGHRRRRQVSTSRSCGSGRNVLLRGQGDCRFERANATWGYDGGDEWTAAFSATWEGPAALPTLAFGNYLDPADEGPSHVRRQRARAAGTGPGDLRPTDTAHPGVLHPVDPVQRLGSDRPTRPSDGQR